MIVEAHRITDGEEYLSANCKYGFRLFNLFFKAQQLFKMQIGFAVC